MVAADRRATTARGEVRGAEKPAGRGAPSDDLKTSGRYTAYDGKG
jgi:hypothetical protein